MSKTVVSDGVKVHKDHAIVHTGSIDVKVLRLNKRQLTMGTFRQLCESLLFNYDGTMSGIPWGWVNYTWGDDHKRGVMGHVVFQKGSYINRCPISYDWVNHLADRERPEVVNLLHDGGLEYTIEYWGQSIERGMSRSRVYIGEVNTIGSDSYVIEDFKWMVRHGAGQIAKVPYNVGKYTFVSEINEKRLTELIKTMIDRKVKKLEAWKISRKSAESRYRTNLDNVLKLDQLFIAT
jgi:hypothetical protein